MRYTKSLRDYERTQEAIAALVGAIENYQVLVEQGKQAEADQYKRVVIQAMAVSLALSAAQIATAIAIYKAIGPVALAAKIATVIGSFVAARIAVAPAVRMANGHTLKRLTALSAEQSAMEATLLA